MPSIQDKHKMLEDPVFNNYLRSQYTAALQDGWWWLEPMPPLLLPNLSARIEYARRMSGRHGTGDPVWGASVIHMAEQASGTPFSIAGTESAVRRSMDLLFSAPGKYREMIKMLCLNWVIADIGAPLEIIWETPRRIRDGVYFRPKPVGLDVFDPAHLRLVAPQNAEYPYAYRSDRQVRQRKPAGWERLFNENEVALHKASVGRIVNLPQTDEKLFGCGASPASFAVNEWQIAMGYLGLLLQDSTNTSAYTILVARDLNEGQVVQAMENRQHRLDEHQTHALASALMLFGNDEALGDGGPGPSVQGVPLRRYPEKWDWRMWLEERIQIYATILGISPMALIMSIYARANQSGAQYAADESGVRSTSLMVGLSDIFADLVGQLGAVFQYRSNKLATRDREYEVKKTAAEAWKILYETNINGVPLLADTPQEAAARARTMMSEERLIKEQYAEHEEYVEWDTEPSNSSLGAKQLSFLAGALRGERYVSVEVDPSGQSTRVSTTVLGRCALRELGRPTQWRGWSSAEIKRMAPLRRAAAALKEAKHKGAMIALYPAVQDAASLALTGEGAEKVENLHVTLAYIGDRQQQTVTADQVRKVVELLAAKTAAQRVTVSGIGRFGKVNQTGTQAFYATVDGPALHDLNEHLTEVLEGIGVVFDDVHGFQPHITLAYVPEGQPSPVDTLSDRPVLLDRIGLAWGTQTYIYPLLPYPLLGGVSSTTGAALHWAWQALYEDQTPFDVAIQQALATPAGAEGVCFLPFLSGERTPFWNDALRGAFYGLTLTHRRSHLLRAVLEGVAFSLRYLLDEFARLNVAIDAIALAGGGAAIAGLPQLVADVCARPVAVYAGEETVTRALYAYACQTLDGEDFASALARTFSATDIYTPSGLSTGLYDSLYTRYCQLAEFADATLAR